MSTATDIGTSHSWYCPAMGAFRKAGEAVLPYQLGVLARLPWIELFTFPAGEVPPGWVLRSYFSQDDASYYLSRRTMPEKTTTSGKLLGLYAAPDTLGNDTAGFVTAEKTGSSK